VSEHDESRTRVYSYHIRVKSNLVPVMVRFYDMKCHGGLVH
jgi:hypothetical protein